MWNDHSQKQQIVIVIEAEQMKEKENINGWYQNSRSWDLGACHLRLLRTGSSYNAMN